jgi:hypothetical protein
VLVFALIALGTGCEIGERSQSTGSSVADFDRKREELELHKRFRLYYLGRSFDGFELARIGYDHEPWRPVSFIYGDCEVPLFADGGCAPPYEVQVAPACPRHQRVLRSRGGRLTIRGVPAAQIDAGIQLHTGTVTVTIYGGDRKRRSRAVRALRPLGSGATTARLPAPTREVLEGRLPCRQ